MKTLDAHNLPVDKVLSSDFVFEIPRYQRPYAWQAEQAMQLLDDLDQALLRADDEPYFLGSIVLVKKENEPKAEVIDGQQRLTTLTLLLAVLRDLPASPELKTGIQEKIADKGKAWKADVKPTPRLTVRPKDRDFFRDHVQVVGAVPMLIGLTDHAADTQPRQALRDNARALHEELATWTEDRRRDLFEFVTERTQLVVVSTPDESSAHRIFGVMNARGVELSPTDIIKSKVIGLLGDQEDEYADKWDKAEDGVGRDAFTDVFRDVRTIIAKRPVKVEILKEFQDQVLSSYPGPAGAVSFVDSVVVPYSTAFEQTLNPDFGPGPEWEQVNTWLIRLGRFDNNDWRPAALWALRNHQDDPVFLGIFLRKLERLAASMLLRGMYSTPRIARYLELLREVDTYGHSAPSFDLSDEEKASTREGIDGPIYKLQSQRRKLVMLRIDGLVAEAEGATYHHKTITVEHVLPQTPKDGSGWVSGPTGFTEDERHFWTHRLGNLVLLNKVVNSAARNYEFDVKKTKYFQTKNGVTNYALTTQVIHEQMWTPTVVAKRQKDLTQRLVDEWELN